MAKNLLAITVAGQLKWLEEAISTLRDPLDVLVIDDATPGDEIRDFCGQKGIKFITKEKPMGLTDSWNTAYRYFKEHNYDNCIISNDDVRFPQGFSEGLFKGLKEFDLVSPLSNEPGNIWDSVHSPAHQQIRRYVDIEPNEKNYDKVQGIISKRYGAAPFRQANFINGFCLAFSRSISKFTYDKQFLFNPASINTWNEYPLAERINGKGGNVGICKTSYVFHWKDKTFEKFERNRAQAGDYREQLWKAKKTIEIKDMPLRECVDRLKNKEYFSFVRYGDGEWKALLEGSGRVACGLQAVNPQIQSDMIRSLTSHATEPKIIFGMQSLGFRIFGHLILDFLQKHKLENIRWVDADMFHDASRDGLLYPLIEQLRKMKVVIIGPSLLRNLRDGVFRYAKFIETKTNCYREQSAIKVKILQAHKELKEDVVYSFCCGPLAETLILDLHSQMPKNFLIDFGSLWDVFCGVRSRGYTRNKKYTDDILKRNLEMGKPKLHLGCGNRHLDGYVNIDWIKTPATDLVHDLKKGLPYPDESVELIESYHFIEHLSKNGAARLIKECHRVLIPGSKIIIECPNLDQAIKEYLAGNEERLIYIFGLERFPGDTHLWGYNPKRLKRLLEVAGFRDVKIKNARDYHAKTGPCIRVEAFK